MAASPATILLLSTRTGTERAAADVVGAAVVVGVTAADEAAAEVGALGAVVLAGTCGAAVALEVGESLVPEASVSASELDSDIAPRPAKTMANAISTIARARNGGPPEVGFG
ncbi:hypothetical protein IFM12275_37350 [Nocardia sputorum]|uniref:Secreted protein n=1 Tax=Nocardia sputorum TaxID=2984338 RepID=A0ABM8D638_9NOCA|nr:hypothetical protein IFM12275_37350 [Nocardia sputorum]BDU02905.1 hypothetical protein IFM12276_59330 [Nocardia sputorum]